ncbi:uncharacterized protein LOC124498574 [Dermatophagoides farinae]|uniref:Uncharacterized protein n=1 Tax=Dermatophagoides farinae TaxID=6954 RepID=A0A922LAK4_DERFA|nr:uncharacterized protein LOC124498574 [Dermatophagoides farinae]KAH7636522.1 hypothetical protein HUG17_10492 [Dermatophagoides farinae]KAH9528594.1 hypothetical protein DERF_002524 [Dermatophagoides farinae]
MDNTERDLCQLIIQARRLPCEQLEPCKDWTKEEIARAKKMYQKIDRLQSSPKISSKLFNEARDCCDMLSGYIRKLELHMLSSNTRAINSLTDLGNANKAAAIY